MVRHTAILFDVPDADPRRNRLERRHANGRTTIVAAGSPEQALSTASELVAEGATLIELCGGISPVWRAKAMAAAGDRARVSSVTFGIDSLIPAARYNAAFERGEQTREAFLLLEPGADPAADRFRFAMGRLQSDFFPVTDEDSAAAVAGRLAGEGVQLIELYGGLSSAGIAKVIQAVNGRAAVGAGSFALDALG